MLVILAGYKLVLNGVNFFRIRGYFFSEISYVVEGGNRLGMAGKVIVPSAKIAGALFGNSARSLRFK
jgi:hypothetical protein